jgi:hypothetical protein
VGAAGAVSPPAVSVLVGLTAFAGEIWGGPRTWADKAHPTLSSFHEVDRGGHFPAWKEPQPIAIEGRTAFRPPR